MDQGKEKEPCGGTALIVTKNDFYYTVIRCIGIIVGVQSSSLAPSNEVFLLIWVCNAALLFSILWDWLKSR